MPRTRTTPEALKTAHYDTIDLLGVQIAYNSNMEASAAGTEFIYSFSHRDAAGEVIESYQEKIPWGDLPGPVKTILRDLYSKALQDAEIKGHLGAGTDENDL